MPRPLEELPLFPLGSVLFPHAVLQLHVFEPRYREMVRACLEEDRPFGVALIRSGREVGGPADPYLVGTRGRIQTVHTYDDGRMDIRVLGGSRFRIRRTEEVHPWLSGWVETLQEEPWDEKDGGLELLNRAREVGEAFVSQVFAKFDFKIAQVKLHEDPQVLSFILSDLLQADSLTKQRLLEITSTKERLTDLLVLLEGQLEQKPTGPTRLTWEDILPHLSDN